MAQIMMAKGVILHGVVMLKIIYTPFYRRFFHNGSVVVFSSVTVSGLFVTCKVTSVTSVTYNVTLQIKRWASLPVGSGNGVNRRFVGK